jgi:hypothetical protein
MSRSKRATKCHAPRALMTLIHMANSVPPHMELPDVKQNKEKIVELWKSETFSGFRNLFRPLRRDSFLKQVYPRRLPKHLNEMIVFGNYALLRDTRLWLRAIATIGARENRGYHMKWPMPRLSLPSVSVHTDSTGRLQFNIHHLIRAPEGVEANRIRICSECRAIFWASRKDRPCCSAKCGHIRRTRLWRKGYPEKYKHRRMARQESLERSRD